MSQHNNFLATPTQFSYSSNNQLVPIHNLYDHQVSCSQNKLIETLEEMNAVKSLVEASNKKIEKLHEMVENCQKTIKELTEEVISVKLENRRHQNLSLCTDNKKLSNLPCTTREGLFLSNNDLEYDEDLLDQFKHYINKVCSDGQSQFLRAAIRKVFTDEVASVFSWKGTAEKPSAEKLFIISIIKSICHLKFQKDEKDMNGVLQKHFAHAKERVLKRKKTGKETCFKE
ncbi:uncharacterized protein [Eurosta solidaginis]|uniref:uncharacterized protein n=1 Tax=Eurosta solidaginis TaxID=178769 RepID=UPI0035312A4F